MSFLRKKIVRVICAVLVAINTVGITAETNSVSKKSDGLFKRAELYSNFSGTDEKLSIRAQEKFIFRDAEIRFNENFGFINFKESESENSEVTLIPGVSISSPETFLAYKLPFKITAKTGMISASGLYSRLYSPATSLPSTVFSSQAKAANALTIHLPSSSSTEKPYAASGEFICARKNKIFSNANIEFFTQAGGSYAVGGGIIFSPTKKIEFGANFVTARFFFGKKSTYWFSDTMLFPEQWFQQLAATIFFKSTNFSATITATAHEQPTGKLEPTAQTKMTFRYGPIFLNASFFYGGENKFFCGNANSQNVQTQFVVNPQVRFVFFGKKQINLNFGFSAGIETKKGTEEFLERSTQKYIIGSQISTEFLRANFSTFVSLSKSKSWNISASASFPKILFMPSIIFTSVISEPESGKYKNAKQTASISGSYIIVPKQVRFDASLAVTCNERFPNDEPAFFNGGTFSVSTAASWTVKYLKISGKITFKFGIDKEE